MKKPVNKPMKQLIKQLREAEKLATQGEWTIKEDLPMDEACCEWHDVGPFDMLGAKANADDNLIILMRNNLVTLLDYVEGLEKEKAACLKYCQEQNGLPYCKNCGLSNE